MTRRELPVLVARLRAESERLARSVATAEDLARSVGSGDRDAARLALACTTVHSFYNGLERWFDLVARDVDESRPAGPSSHRDLLDQVAVAVAGLRPAVIAEELRRVLLPYLDFRHRFRHLYFFDLDWPDVEPLLTGLPRLWAVLGPQLDGFLDELERRGRESGGG